MSLFAARKRPYSHGVMLHHFHGGKHLPGQGSLSSQRFHELLLYLKSQYKILNADQYTEKFLNKTLSDDHICITFDDALLCQVDIAAPVLAEHGIKAFFFVQSSPFFGNPDVLEIYRAFRHSEYESIDAFYETFFARAEKMFSEQVTALIAGYNVNEDRKEFPMYSPNDKKFRFLRFNLGKEKYDVIMQRLMKEKDFVPDKILDSLWMKNEHLKSLDRAGHMIGLHSFSHPVSMNTFSADEQREEYSKNYSHITEVLGKKPVSVSYPCGRYNDDTFDIMRDLGIVIGFRASMAVPVAPSAFEIPREDHANIVSEMRV